MNVVQYWKQSTANSHSWEFSLLISTIHRTMTLYTLGAGTYYGSFPWIWSIVGVSFKWVQSTVICWNEQWKLPNRSNNSYCSHTRENSAYSACQSVHHYYMASTLHNQYDRPSRWFLSRYFFVLCWRSTALVAGRDPHSPNTLEGAWKHT